MLALTDNRDTLVTWHHIRDDRLVDGFPNWWVRPHHVHGHVVLQRLRRGSTKVRGFLQLVLGVLAAAGVLLAVVWGPQAQNAEHSLVLQAVSRRSREVVSPALRIRINSHVVREAQRPLLREKLLRRLLPADGPLIVMGALLVVDLPVALELFAGSYEVVATIGSARLVLAGLLQHLGVGCRKKLVVAVLKLTLKLSHMLPLRSREAVVLRILRLLVRGPRGTLDRRGLDNRLAHRLPRCHRCAGHLLLLFHLDHTANRTACVGSSTGGPRCDIHVGTGRHVDRSDGRTSDSCLHCSRRRRGRHN